MKTRPQAVHIPHMRLELCQGAVSVSSDGKDCIACQFHTDRPTPQTCPSGLCRFCRFSASLHYRRLSNPSGPNGRPRRLCQRWPSSPSRRILHSPPLHPCSFACRAAPAKETHSERVSDNKASSGMLVKLVFGFGVCRIYFRSKGRECESSINGRSADSQVHDCGPSEHPLPRQTKNPTLKIHMLHCRHWEIKRGGSELKFDTGLRF